MSRTKKRGTSLIGILLCLPGCGSPIPKRSGLAWVPPGTVRIGDRLGVGQEDERPVRSIALPGLWFAVHETTNREYAEFLSSVDEVDPCWAALDSRKFRITKAAKGDYTTDAPDLPVVTVSHAGALAFCRWRTQSTGEQHRLPSEAEWERAARGPQDSTYAYGNTYTQAAANQESGVLKTVGSFPPNGFGLFDMTGNAFEWMADAYQSDAYKRPYRGAVLPQGEATYRVLRGGSFVLDGIYLRNAMRMRLRPQVRADDVGFRYVVDPNTNEDP